ncbi:hypothetical protein CHS0354_025489 [Potamilus streckersoni]|uniref:Protein zer-1 homolog-like C-terminal domain-containing protein n=1 Tax=Potamilus streckersoni TaxID=2493646 RepID=A0AAE0RS92_9BIVA|nr:hypothetical protein CHS0354_025489 [Potamilus streckersoni]
MAAIMRPILQAMKLYAGGYCKMVVIEVKEFLRSHSSIQFIGLALTPACNYSCFLGDKEFETLTITGEANERQILESLRRYTNRSVYMHATLRALFPSTSEMSLPREDLLKLILLALKQNPDDADVYDAGLSCVFNLLNHELGTKVHPTCLKEIVNRTLQAMTNFPRDVKYCAATAADDGHPSVSMRTINVINSLEVGLEMVSPNIARKSPLQWGDMDVQIQKLAVYILYRLRKKKILEDMISDFDNAATLIMESLCSFDVPGMTYRCVYMLSSLTAKISTSDIVLRNRMDLCFYNGANNRELPDGKIIFGSSITQYIKYGIERIKTKISIDLGSNRRYIQKVLQIVEKSIVNHQIELFLEDLLFMFGNLTVNSSVACQVFVSEGGFELFLRLFQTSHDLASCEKEEVEHLLLQTLFNMVTEEELHPSIMCLDLLLVLKQLMQSDFNFVKFMAATVLSQLACKGENKRFMEDSKTGILDHLNRLGLSWQHPEEQLIYCRSLNIFFPLLNCFETPAVQLWALRLIEHSCMKNGQLYCRMLEDEGGITILCKLAEDSQTNESAVRIIRAILQMVEQNTQ